MVVTSLQMHTHEMQNYPREQMWVRTVHPAQAEISGTVGNNYWCKPKHRRRSPGYRSRRA